ncbi:tail completion protein gp17 [Pseudogemmobacter bohemicus]|uniref:tail completion protein gp17 n=1 Tax=Pseudogemmobacter bohemicus TaxID=2250708 RepID=UPI000DD2B7CE|nr:DUF3168 domain-containing protein [Pseudogemmobacter bohemicus]
MMERAVQVAIRDRLVAMPAVVSLVPAAKIRDVGIRPKDFPTIALGESQVVDEGTSLARLHVRVFHTLHVWVKEPTLEQVTVASSSFRKRLSGASGCRFFTGFTRVFLSFTRVGWFLVARPGPNSKCLLNSR